MTAEISPAQAEITRLLRVQAHQSEMFDRSRQFWLRAGRMALGGDDRLLRHAIMTSAEQPDLPPIDGLLRRLRIRHRQFSMADLRQFVEAIGLEGGDPAELRRGEQMKALLIHILDELATIEDQKELTF